MTELARLIAVYKSRPPKVGFTVQEKSSGIKGKVLWIGRGIGPYDSLCGVGAIQVSWENGNLGLIDALYWIHNIEVLGRPNESN